MKSLAFTFPLVFLFLGFQEIQPRDSQWIDLFDGKTLFGWKEGAAKSCSVEKGVLKFPSEDTGNLISSSAFGNFQAELTYEYLKGAKDGAVFFVPKESLKKDWNSIPLPVANGKSKFLFQVQGGRIFTSTKGEKATGVWGCLGVQGKGLLVHSLKVKPLLPESLFSGKDFSGWRIFPGKKSKFTVSEEEFRVQDGPGDLQTIKSFGNFILQFDVKSNGKHLNSGLFFRCIPDEYQKGYEVQIRNQWEGENKSKPVDFGTGAIYRRQPARLVNAEDGQWATITLVAVDNHFCTWVNGIQVTDWSDPRPANKNAREGFRKEPGCLSIQGHDPTTNLSFRQFRIWPGD